jgi:hypothetical protein
VQARLYLVPGLRYPIFTCAFAPDNTIPEFHTANSALTLGSSLAYARGSLLLFCFLLGLLLPSRHRCLCMFPVRRIIHGKRRQEASRVE